MPKKNNIMKKKMLNRNKNNNIRKKKMLNRNNKNINFNKNRKNNNKKNNNKIKNKNKNKNSDILLLHNINLNDLNFALIFVCHSEEIVKNCLLKFPGSYILFVGQNKCKIINDNIIIVRDLQYNIEHYPLLLTFTAWYAISKNNLYKDKDYLCIFEYDVIFNEELLKNINLTIENNQPKCISFLKNLNGVHFNIDINVNNICLFTKNNNYNINNTWFATTNHCLKRDLLNEFVDWYYPQCIDNLMHLDRNKIPWYHERLFNVYLYEKLIDDHLSLEKNNILIYLPGLKHIFNNSHNNNITNITNRFIKVNHNAGFFSCCSVRLDNIINGFNKYNHLPYFVDSSEQFNWYKPENFINSDITYSYFKNIPNYTNSIKYLKNIDYKENYQYSIYKNLDFENINLFIQKYFSLSDEILKIKDDIIKKYNINFENICVLFYRGNDKSTEVKLPNYNDYLLWGQKILDLNPNIQFLIQSDETEFIKHMTNSFKNNIVFNDEIRHMSRCKNTVDKINVSNNFEFSKKYLAITYIMSQCKYLVFGSGNCSIWIVFYRGNSHNIIQFLNGKWYDTL